MKIVKVLCNANHIQYCDDQYYALKITVIGLLHIIIEFHLSKI